MQILDSDKYFFKKQSSEKQLNLSRVSKTNFSTWSKSVKISTKFLTCSKAAEWLLSFDSFKAISSYRWYKIKLLWVKRYNYSVSGSDSDFRSNSMSDSDSDSDSNSSSVFISLVIFVSIHDSVKKLFMSQCHKKSQYFWFFNIYANAYS